MKKIIIAFVCTISLSQAFSQNAEKTTLSSRSIYPSIDPFGFTTFTTDVEPFIDGVYLHVPVPAIAVEQGGIIELYNATGKLVKRARVRSQMNTIYIGDLKAGTYNLLVTWATGGYSTVLEFKFKK